MVGLMTENGPIQVEPGTQKLVQNKYAWNNLVDYIWVDNPVGVGFSTADSNGYAADETQVGSDFVGFLENLVQVFPSLATRPFYLTGESYAGRYIPYITQALFSMSNPPVQLSKMVVGDPAFGSNAEFKVMPTLSLLQTYPQIIGYDTGVYDYFKQQSHLCGLDINISYPQTGGPLPAVNLTPGTNPASQNQTEPDADADKDTKVVQLPQAPSLRTRGFADEVAYRFARRGAAAAPKIQRRSAGKSWKDVAANSSGVNPWYGCDVWDEMIDYALNYTYPWSKYEEFDTFDVPDALYPETSDDPTFFFTNSQVVKALHAPQNTQWSSSINYPWGSQPNGRDPSPEPMQFFTQLATNATQHGVHVITYVGNDDGISPHFGTEVTIQNTTFGGIQGFTRQPSTSWYNDNGDWAGIVHQERNWTYALVYGAGHEVPHYQPVSAYTFLREFILGTNQTGLVVASGNTSSVVGGENPTLKQTAVPGAPAIFYGATTTAGSTVWPSATVAAFESHIGQGAVTGTAAVRPSATAANGAAHMRPRHAGSVAFAVAMAKLAYEML
ncbi:serine carboxypeptidase [Phanerochaete sordida]|uniref:Carboxypeptidase n=1 Tax=Phanerochaete sordida TaxID=48140 RepID=A0A9P3LLL9_9APHY|nr:serine carboxypeptidase [Phanerochaete sordida]